MLTIATKFYSEALKAYYNKKDLINRKIYPQRIFSSSVPDEIFNNL